MEKPIVQEKGKLIDLDLEGNVEEIPMDEEDIDMGVEDIDVEGSEPISKFPEYILPCRGKTKFLKDINESKVTLHTPLFPDKMIFEGPHLWCITHLKLEDWDLDDIEHFPHLAKDQLMNCISYKCSSVTTMEPRMWVKGVDKAGLLNMLWVPHYNRTSITMMVIKKLLCLVHDGCLWPEEPIPITDMLIHRITQLPHAEKIRPWNLA